MCIKGDQDIVNTTKQSHMAWPGKLSSITDAIASSASLSAIVTGPGPHSINSSVQRHRTADIQQLKYIIVTSTK
jgi:hypothetical protein